MWSRVWLILLVALVLISSVSAVMVRDSALNSTGPIQDASSSNANRYGTIFMPIMNYTLYTVQKNTSHNVGDIGAFQIYNQNTTTVVANATSWTGANGDNATFSSPVELIKGYEYRMYELVGTTARTVLSDNGWLNPDFITPYNKFISGCYSTTGGPCNTDHPNQQLFFNTWILYLDNGTAPPDYAPDWYDYGTNITGELLLGNANFVYSNWTDVGGLSHYIFEEMLPNGSRYNNSAEAVTCGDVTDCVVDISGKASPAGIHGFRFFVNDTVNNWNVTPQFNLTVYDNAPQWISYSQNDSSFILGGAVEIYGNWSDNYNLSCHQINIWNASQLFANVSTCTWAGFTVPNTIGNVWWTIATANNVGEFQWRLGANDTGNLWNYTGFTNFTVLPIPAPEWDAQYMRNVSGMYPNETEFTYGTHWLLLSYGANWSTPEGNLSHFIVQTWNTTHWTNSSANPFSIFTYDGCITDYNETCDAWWKVSNDYDYAHGDWYWTMYANNTIGDNTYWAETPLFSFTLKKQSNLLANLSYWRITPCLDGAWQVGENVTFWLNITDPEADTVQGRILLYDDNDTYRNDSGWQTAVSSSTLWNYSFVATNITPSATWVIQVRDTYNETVTNTSEDFSVVASMGLLHGECYTDIDDVEEVFEEEEEEVIEGFWDDMVSSISIPLAMFWVLLMLIFIIVIWVKLHREAMLAAGASFGIALLWTFLGLIINVLSAALFTLLLIIILAALGMTIWLVMKSG